MKENIPSIEDSRSQILDIFRKSLSLVKVHRPLLLFVAILLWSISMYLFSWRINLIIHWERTVGKIMYIDANYTFCESDKKKVPCTEFTITVQFYTLSWKSVKFTNRIKDIAYQDHAPIWASGRYVGENVNVIYLPSDPMEESYENTFSEIWLIPIIIMFGHLWTFLLAFSRWKK